MKQVFIGLLFLVNFANAQPIVWVDDQKELKIGTAIEILEDPDGNFAFDEVSSGALKDSFVPWESPILTVGYTESVFWVKFSLKNPTDDNLILEVAQAGLPDCDLYTRLDDDSVLIQKAGANTKFHERVIKSSFQVFPLQKGSHEYYLRLTSNSGPIPLNIIERKDYDEQSISLKFVYGAYLGLMLFVFLSNMFFFFSLRNFLYAANALNVILFTCYSMVVVDAFVVYFFEQVDILFWYTTIPPIGVTIQTIYSLWFLEVKKYRPKLYRVVVGLIVIYIIWFVLKFFLSFPVVQPINTLQALLSFFVMGIIGVRVGQKGNRFGYYFALTYFVYFLLVLTEATYINTGLPEYILGFSYSGHATVLEALALSFLLTKRFEWEKKELVEARWQAQQEAIEQTRENERIVREQNVILEQKVEERTHELFAEKKKSDDLLYNILPEEVAEELKESGESIARQFDSVSVLFTDFQSFIQTTEKFSAKELVTELNVCFKAFDDIVTNCKLEKIKTIGDAYMAASGLPVPSEDSVKATVLAALEMQQFIAGRKANKQANGEVAFDMRVGIHTGPVVAGIVGVKKFQYDIWGDTVNTASRMESYGAAGRVNISNDTYELIKDDAEFTFESRGKVNVKGKGEMEMWFVSKT